MFVTRTFRRPTNPTAQDGWQSRQISQLEEAVRFQQGARGPLRWPFAHDGLWGDESLLKRVVDQIETRRNQERGGVVRQSLATSRAPHRQERPRVFYIFKMQNRPSLPIKKELTVKRPYASKKKKSQQMSFRGLLADFRCRLRNEPLD